MQPDEAVVIKVSRPKARKGEAMLIINFRAVLR
jgi:hypothetical protein